MFAEPSNIFDNVDQVEDCLTLRLVKIVNMLPNVAETGIFCNYDPAIHVAISFSNHIVLSVQLFYSMRDFIVIYL